VTYMRKVEVKVGCDPGFETVVMSFGHFDRLLAGEVRLYCVRCRATTWHTRVCSRPPHKPVSAKYIQRARMKTFRCQECGAISKLKKTS